MEENSIGSQQVKLPPLFKVAQPSDTSGSNLVVVRQLEVLEPIDWGVLTKQQLSQNLTRNCQL